MFHSYTTRQVLCEWNKSGALDDGRDEKEWAQTLRLKGFVSEINTSLKRMFTIRNLALVMLTDPRGSKLGLCKEMPTELRRICSNAYSL